MVYINSTICLQRKREYINFITPHRSAFSTPMSIHIKRISVWSRMKIVVHAYPTAALRNPYAVYLIITTTTLLYFGFEAATKSPPTTLTPYPEHAVY